MWVTEIGRFSLRTRFQKLDREQVMLTVSAQVVGLPVDDSLPCCN